MEQSSSDGAGPSNGLAVQVSEEIVKNVGELAAETAIAFAMTRGRAKGKKPGSNTSSGIKAPVKRPRGRPRKEPKTQLVVSRTPVAARVERVQPPPEEKKLSSLAGPGREFLSGQQISQILEQDLKKKIETSMCGGAGVDVPPESMTCAPTTASGQPPVKKRRGRKPRKTQETEIAAALATASQPPMSGSLPFRPELLATKLDPGSIATSGGESEDSDGTQRMRPTEELEGSPIAVITVNDGAGNMQPAALIVMHPSPSAGKPRGRPRKSPLFEQPVIDMEAASTEAAPMAESEGVHTSVKPPGDAVAVKKRRGRPPKKTLLQTPPTAPAMKPPRGRPKKPRANLLPREPLPPPPQQAAVVETRATDIRTLESTQPGIVSSEEFPVAAATEERRERPIHPTPLQQPSIPEAKQTNVVEATAFPVVSGESPIIPVKKRRGRPPKQRPVGALAIATAQESPIKPKRPRGRPKKSALLSQPRPCSPQPDQQASWLPPELQTEEVSANSENLDSKTEDAGSAKCLPTKRPRGRPAKPRPAIARDPVATVDVIETRTELDSPTAMPDGKPIGRARKNPQPKKIRPAPASPPVTIQVPAVALAGGVEAMEERDPDADEETAQANVMDAPNIPLPLEILSRVRSVLPPEEATSEKEVLQQAEPPTMACSLADGVHTVLSPVVNVGIPWKRPLQKYSVEGSLQGFEGPTLAKEPPVKRQRGRPPKKHPGLTPSPPKVDISSALVKRRPGRPRKRRPPPTPSLTETKASTEAKPEDTLTKSDLVVQAAPTQSATVSLPVKRPIGRPRKKSSLSSTATAEIKKLRKILPKVSEMSSGQAPTLPAKKRRGRPRKRPLEPEPAGEKQGPPTKKRRGRPPKKKKPNETDETGSVCSPDEGTLTAQVKAVVTALPIESAFGEDSEAASATVDNETSTPIKRQDSNFQLRLSVSFSDSSDDMNTETDTRTALQILAEKVHESGTDPKVEESEDETSSSYVSVTFD